MRKEDSAEQWTAELRQNGRLVLGVRRDKAAYVAFIAFIAIVNGGNAGRELHAGTWSGYDYFRAAIAVIATVYVLSALNAIRGGRSRVTVDDAGVSTGRGRLAWSEIDRVEVEDGKVILHSGPRELKLALSDLVVRHPKHFAA